MIPLHHYYCCKDIIFHSTQLKLWYLISLSYMLFGGLKNETQRRVIIYPGYIKLFYIYTMSYIIGLDFIYDLPL